MGSLPQMPQVTESDIFRMVMIDRKRLVKVNIELRDADGDSIPVRDVIEKLTEYVSDKLKDDGENICRSQIYPMMAHAIAGGLIKMTGVQTAAYILSSEVNRYALIHMMTVGFYLLKWIQQKNLKVYTTEEPVTQDEIEKYERVSRANDLGIQYQAMGGDAKVLLKEMLKEGSLKPEDLKEIGAEYVLEEDTKEDKN